MVWSTNTSHIIDSRPELTALVGKRVQLKQDVIFPRFQVSRDEKESSLDLKRKTIGFIGGVVSSTGANNGPFSLMIAFPKPNKVGATSLSSLKFGEFDSTLLDLPTVRHNFYFEK